MPFLFSWLAKLLGKNLQATPSAVISSQMLEPRPLPMGRAEFEIWASRIISGTLCSATTESQKFALAEMLMHLGPTEDHKPDAYFIHCLRKSAVNQVAFAMLTEMREAAKQRLAAEELEKSKLASGVAKPDEILADHALPANGTRVVPAP